jgi:nicotinamide riboside kinase
MFCPKTQYSNLPLLLLSMVKKIVITGPESSGKTTLARFLAERLGTVWVPEFARTYLQHLGRPYHNADLDTILKGQLAWEKWYEQLAHEYLVCDTDWTVLDIWRRSRGLEGIAKQHQAPWHLAVLCTPDFDWEPDPLREHPFEQQAFFEQYAQLLQQQNSPFVCVSGAVPLRIEKILETLPS